jgi:hypothetical protein
MGEIEEEQVHHEDSLTSLNHQATVTTVNTPSHHRAIRESKGPRLSSLVPQKIETQSSIRVY